SPLAAPPPARWSRPLPRIPLLSRRVPSLSALVVPAHFPWSPCAVPSPFSVTASKLPAGSG
ncbi:hypothetical protein P7K49_017136, partial [Saguinus oedipus]